jgi:hypothetical protein
VKHLRINLYLTLALLLMPIAAAAQSPCPRFAPGSTVVNPPALFSQDGTLTVNLAYNTAQDAQGRTLFCFTTPDGSEGPTLHINPGDHLIINVKNNLPTPASDGDQRAHRVRRHDDELLVGEHSLSRDQHAADLP